MRHLIIFISFLSMVWSSAIAQTYTGRIEDSENKQAIEFANIVVLQKSDNKYLTGVTSAEDGSKLHIFDIITVSLVCNLWLWSVVSMPV